jgi:hypothetical protein
MSSKNVLTLLGGGDRRSTGRSDQVARMVSRTPRLFSQLIAGLWSDDPLLRMRAADAAEKVTRSSPRLLQPYRKELLGLLAESRQQEVRWHLAAMIPRLALIRSERHRAAGILETYLEDRSSIVKTSALQGIADLARQDPSLRAPAIELLRKSLCGGTPAMKARSRRLLATLEED